MNSYKSSAELKAMAKEQLFGNYGTVIGATVLVFLITQCMSFLPGWFVDTTTLPGIIINYLIGFIISVFGGLFVSGQAFMYLKLTCRQPITVSDVFYGFKIFPDKALILELVITAVTYVCLLPMQIFNQLSLTHSGNGMYMLLASVFTIIGAAILVIVSLMFSQAFYLLQDFPQYSARELLQMSRQIMKGHKARLFYIELSFIPLFLLGLLSCCIAFLWIVPYMNAVKSNFYMDLMTKQKAADEEK